MSGETTKTWKFRPASLQPYLSGRIIDIGCGGDLVVPHAEPFDLAHGDANNILAHLSAHTYDCVFSSHCLEHMRDADKALQGWWELVKDGGCMVIVVPDEDLYEQGIWPPLFNTDHKFTFRASRCASWSPVSRNIKEMIEALDGAELLAVEHHDNGYDYSLQAVGTKSFGRSNYKYQLLLHQKAAGLRRRLPERLHGPITALERLGRRLLFWLGIPVDQTLSGALAQIHVAVRKSAAATSKGRGALGVWAAETHDVTIRHDDDLPQLFA